MHLFKFSFKFLSITILLKLFSCSTHLESFLFSIFISSFIELLPFHITWAGILFMAAINL